MSEAVEAYCVKCREKREIKDPVPVEMKNGRHAIQGTCPVCGTKLFRMVSDKAAKTSESETKTEKPKTAKASASDTKAEKPKAAKAKS